VYWQKANSLNMHAPPQVPFHLQSTEYACAVLLPISVRIKLTVNTALCECCSPGYRDHNAYWVGASDKTYEGDFRWSDGLPFSYTSKYSLSLAVAQLYDNIQ
jgi:hypothetical protein